VDEFLALSEFSAQKHRDFGFPAPMTVFPSFLPDAEDGGPAENAPKQNDDTEMSESALPYFLFVGRLEPIKGLVDVIPRFTDDMPAELWIVGSGTQEEELKKLAKGRKNVKFLGRKTPSELRSLYRDARALIASSRCFEVFPLVLLEAFREGTPTIARDLGPYPEIVHQANAGLLFSDDDSLDRALRQLATDAKLRNDLGESGARAFAERWSEDVVMEKYLATIRKHAERRDLSGTLARLNRSP
jgi:glycosyltransferase involved in cell wall biosynthesis